jgi:hypothetical protein
VSFLIGFIAALMVSVVTIVWALRAIRAMSPVALLAGQPLESHVPPDASFKNWSVWACGGSLLGALTLFTLGHLITDHMAEALTFFGSGMFLLIALLAGIWAWLRQNSSRKLTGQGPLAIARLGVRNAARHPVRSLLTGGLIAFAAFIVVAVESFYRDASAEGLGPQSGTGGFALVGESTLPIFQDINTEDGQDALNIPDPPNPTLNASRIFNFRLRAGDDASCLNLYQPTRPRIMGLPDAFVELNRFSFSREGTENPWTQLRTDDTDEVPAIADATTAQYILKINLGDTVEIIDERGKPARLRIVALLTNSILQSELLISEADFLRLYPSHEGYQFFLIECPTGQAEKVRTLLETSLAERGFTATAATRRLEAYWAVENTYLATFQALGGLGLLLGAVGLGVVLLRTVWERRGELALLRALGYPRQALGWLLFTENGFLFMFGLAIGVVSALFAVIPHLGRVEGGYSVVRLATFIGAVVVVGLTAGVTATIMSLRAPLVPALRRE